MLFSLLIKITPFLSQKFPGEDITFESFRKLLYQSGGFDADTKVERRVQIYERFKNEPFESLIAKTEEKVKYLLLFVNPTDAYFFSRD